MEKKDNQKFRLSIGMWVDKSKIKKHQTNKKSTAPSYSYPLLLALHLNFFERQKSFYFTMYENFKL